MRPSDGDAINFLWGPRHHRVLPSIDIGSAELTPKKAKSEPYVFDVIAQDSRGAKTANRYRSFSPQPVAIDSISPPTARPW